MIRISMPVGTDSPRQESGHHGSFRANFPLGSTLPFPPFIICWHKSGTQEWCLDLTLGATSFSAPDAHTAGQVGELQAGASSGCPGLAASPVMEAGPCSSLGLSFFVSVSKQSELVQESLTKVIRWPRRRMQTNEVRWVGVCMCVVGVEGPGGLEATS